MPGSGKSLVSEAATSAGFRNVCMGNIIRDEADARGIVKTPSSLGALMLELRKSEGEDVVARRCLKKAVSMGDLVVIEGIRSLKELQYFREHSNLFLVAVHASPLTRFQRLLKRGREDDPKDRETFDARDMRELGIGIGSVIALADQVFINEFTVEYLKMAAKSFFEGVKSESKCDRQG
jgi:dephospho-CoA kinase